MDNFDFAAQPPTSRDRIYVSWSEQWDLPRYVEAYLKERGLRTDQAAHERVQKAIAKCPVKGALRKADIDYYLDCHVKQELVLPEMKAVKRK